MKEVYDSIVIILGASIPRMMRHTGLCTLDAMESDLLSRCIPMLSPLDLNPSDIQVVAKELVQRVMEKALKDEVVVKWSRSDNRSSETLLARPDVEFARVV